MGCSASRQQEEVIVQEIFSSATPPPSMPQYKISITARTRTGDNKTVRTRFVAEGEVGFVLKVGSDPDSKIKLDDANCSATQFKVHFGEQSASLQAVAPAWLQITRDYKLKQGDSFKLGNTTLEVKGLSLDPPFLDLQVVRVLRGAQWTVPKKYHLKFETGSTFTLGTEEQEKNNHVRLIDDHHMEDVHATIEKRDGDFILKDNQSRTGTFVSFTGQVQITTDSLRVTFGRSWASFKQVF